MIKNELGYILIPFITVVFAQIIKVIVEAFIYKKIDLVRLLDGSGGMPSSHSAFAFSLVAAIGKGEGINTAIFALALVFACLTAYDAMGIRYESGKQAKVINQIFEKLNWEKQFGKLKEKVGHKPIEVLFGILFGISMGLILYGK
jgi:acid phosphatase family membrane protein YuiD